MKNQKDQIVIVTKPIQPDGKTGYGLAIVNALKELVGKRAIIIIQEYRKIRSNKQNRYYWGVVLKAYQRYFQSNNVYMSDDDMHLWIKEYVWRDYVDIQIEDVDSETGEVRMIPFRKILTSTILTTIEWEERMTISRNYAAEHFNIQIPEPNERLDKQILETLEHPEGIYYDVDFGNYFNIVDVPSQRVERAAPKRLSNK